MMESNNGITYTQEIVVVVWQDGERKAAEFQNGHLEIYTLAPQTKQERLELFGLNKVS